ncbi:unnamed protein product, partial [Rotaria sp. Silwood2]
MREGSSCSSLLRCIHDQRLQDIWNSHTVNIRK